MLYCGLVTSTLDFKRKVEKIFKPLVQLADIRPALA